MIGKMQCPGNSRFGNVSLSPQQLRAIYRHDSLAFQIARPPVAGCARWPAIVCRNKLPCRNCVRQILSNGAIHYTHSILTPVVVQPENPHVLAREPEFVVSQDGHAMQDCESATPKRRLVQHGAFYARQQIPVLGDDLAAV